MLVIIYPTGTKRSIHLNHFVVEAEKADPETIFVTAQEFLEKRLDEWPKDAIFVLRVGAYSVQEILPTLTNMWNKGFNIFPNVPAIKNCLRKGQFYELCDEHNVKIPKFQIFADDGPDWHSIDFSEYGDCVIKPSIGTLGNGIYFVKPEDVADRIDKIYETNDEFYENVVRFLDKTKKPTDKEVTDFIDIEIEKEREEYIPAPNAPGGRGLNEN